MNDTSDPGTPRPEVQTTPLGGSLHSSARREALVRRWSGYVAMVRVCPSCGWENREHDLFCISCAADIQSVPASSSSNAHAGVNLLNRRMKRESLLRERSHPEGPVAGGGWIIVGMFVILVSLFMRVDPFIRTTVWLTGLALAVGGLIQVRRDVNALRAWGALLGAATAGMLVIVSVGAFATDPPASVTPTIVPTAAQLSIATPPVVTDSPVQPILGSVPMYRGGPEHTGVLPGPAPFTTPRLAWRFDSGGEIYSSPAIADNRLFFTSKSGFVYALDASTGDQIWRFQMSDYVARASPAVINGVVYIGGGFGFYALDAETGVERWRADIAYAGQGSPTVQDDVVVVASQEGWLYGIDATTGKIRWRYGTEGLSFGVPTIAGGFVVVGSDNGIVAAVDAPTGRTRWRADVGGPVFGSPAISGGRIFVTTQTGQVVALGFEKGDVLWTANRGGSESPGAFADLVVVSSADGGVYGYDASTGQQRWIYASGASSATSPVSVGSTVIIGSGDQLVALDGGTGAQSWYFLAGDTIDTSPVVLDGFVFFGSRDGFLYAVTDRPETAT